MRRGVARWAGLTAPRSGGAYGGGSDVGTPKPPAPSFSIDGRGWYQHFSGSSAICVSFETTAAQPNAATSSVTVTGGSVRGARSQTTRLDSRGKGDARFEIDAYGTYTVEVSITAGGKTVKRTFVVEVGSGAGSAPCS